MHPFDRLFRYVMPPGAIAVLGTVIGVGWFTQPDRYAGGYAPTQPIAFSHELHAGTLKVPCAYCHSGAARSRVAGIPSVETCMDCHRVTKTDSPEIKKLTEVYASGRPLEWQRVHSLPDHVLRSSTSRQRWDCVSIVSRRSTDDESGVAGDVLAHGQLSRLPSRPP